MGVLLFLATHGLGLATHLALVVGVTLLGIWASAASEAVFGCSDDGRIVIDEVAGQWIALTPLLALSGGSAAFLLAVVTAFVAFRVFDIWKPGPVGWAERRFGGGVGVMADDCVAGLLAALLVGVVLVLLTS
jgi:phosphatidylglycerophosphatase A